MLVLGMGMSHARGWCPRKQQHVGEHEEGAALCHSPEQRAGGGGKDVAMGGCGWEALRSPWAAAAVVGSPLLPSIGGSERSPCRMLRLGRGRNWGETPQSPKSRHLRAATAARGLSPDSLAPDRKAVKVSINPAVPFHPGPSAAAALPFGCLFFCSCYNCRIAIMLLFFLRLHRHGARQRLRPLFSAAVCPGAVRTARPFLCGRCSPLSEQQMAAGRAGCAAPVLNTRWKRASSCLGGQGDSGLRFMTEGNQSWGVVGSIPAGILHTTLYNPLSAPLSSPPEEKGSLWVLG